MGGGGGWEIDWGLVLTSHMTSTPSLPKLDKVNIQQNFQICSERKKADSWRFELQCQVKNLHSWTNSNLRSEKIQT